METGRTQEVLLPPVVLKVDGKRKFGHPGCMVRVENTSGSGLTPTPILVRGMVPSSTVGSFGEFVEVVSDGERWNVKRHIWSAAPDASFVMPRDARP